jgi:hypothetical protein
MRDRNRILKRLKSQTKIAEDWHKGEIIFETTQQDVGQIIILGDDTAPIRVEFFRKGFRDAFDPNLYKVKRTGIERVQPHVNQPGLFRVLYTHQVVDKATSKVVGEVVTRLFRAPGSKGNHWALLSITIQGIEIYKLEGA